MTSLENIRVALEGLSDHLGLAGEEPQESFDQSLLRDVAALEDGVCRDFSLHLSKRAVALRLSLKALIEEADPESFARALQDLDVLVMDLDRELAQLPEGRAWHICRQFHEVARHLNSPSSAENQSFRNLPEMLYTSEWLQHEVGRLLSQAGLSLPRDLSGKEFRKSRTQKWLDAQSRTPAGALAGKLDALRNDIEFRSRQIWYLLRSEGEEADLPSIYVWAHRDLFPGVSQVSTPEAFTALVGQLRVTMASLDLPDIALPLETPEWLAQYAMNYLIPPAPNEWAVNSGAAMARVLEGRLARWYFYPFAHVLQPIEMISSVLRVGRPLFYERTVAHAISEYAMLQGASVATAGAAQYLEMLALLEREFLILFDGYLLREMFYPKLRAPEGWVEYLEALTALHFRDRLVPGLPQFRHEFLHARGLRSPIEILYRTASPAASIN